LANGTPGSKPEELSVDEIAEQYRVLRPSYERLAVVVRDCLVSEIAAIGLTIDGCTYRVKTVESFQEKVLREEKDYKDPLTEVTDLAGVRAMVHFRSDIETVSDIVRRKFIIDEKNSVDFNKASDPKVFGYNSAHFVVTLPGQLVPAEAPGIATLKCEIQIRTILQHAWAATAHGLIYKPPTEPPRTIERRFYALSGLLEIADNELEDLRDYGRRLESEIGNRIDRGDLEIEIEPIALRVFLSKKAFRNQHGSSITGEVLRDITEEARAVGITTLSALNRAIGEFPAEAVEALRLELNYVRRSGIGKVRDILKYRSPQAYYDFVRQSHPEWDIPTIRVFCDRVAALKRDRLSPGPGEVR